MRATCFGAEGKLCGGLWPGVVHGNMKGTTENRSMPCRYAEDEHCKRAQRKELAWRKRMIMSRRAQEESEDERVGGCSGRWRGR